MQHLTIPQTVGSRGCILPKKDTKSSVLVGLGCHRGSCFSFFDAQCFSGSSANRVMSLRCDGRGIRQARHRCRSALLSGHLDMRTLSIPTSASHSFQTSGPLLLSRKIDHTTTERIGTGKHFVSGGVMPYFDRPKVQGLARRFKEDDSTVRSLA